MENVYPTYKRALAIAIASLLVLLGLTLWGGTRIGVAMASSQGEDWKGKLELANTRLSQLQSSSDTLETQLKSAQADLSQSQSRIETFQRDSSALRAQLGSAETGLSQVQSSYGSLQDSNTMLRTQLASAQAELSQAQSKQSALQQDNASLRAQLDTAATRYNALEKTKVFTVDSRFTVKLSTEAQIGTVAWVRGEVTNTGNTPIRKVYIFMSRYSTDGSLNTVDLPPTVLLNLAPAGVGYFSFLSSGETCKVTVLGDF